MNNGGSGGNAMPVNTRRRLQCHAAWRVMTIMGAASI